jgi:hypothetical protein
MNYCTPYPVAQRVRDYLSLPAAPSPLFYLAAEHLLSEIIGMIRQRALPIVYRSHRALHPDQTGLRQGKPFAAPTPDVPNVGQTVP